MKYIKSSVLLIFILAPLVLALVGEATTYQWIDDGGVVHFTDDQGKIPAKFMKQVTESESVNNTEVNSPAAPPSQSPTVPQARPVAREVTLYGGYDKKYWQSGFASIRTEIKNLESGLVSKKEKLNQLRRNRVMHKRVSDRVAYNNLDNEIGRDEARIKELQDKLKVFETDASNAGVPYEWR